MKISLLLAAFLVYALPAMTFAIVEPVLDKKEATTMTTEAESSLENGTDNQVCVLSENEILTMELETYVTGVVLAEMPAEFDMEALKAQAVVTRTYTCRRLGEAKHDSANVCTDASCCQAYTSVASFLKNGGSEQSVNKVWSAVSDTAGKVLVYGDDLIEATYFSCSGGKTEDAQAVWGTDVPYLQSVESPGEEKAAHYTDSVVFSEVDFCQMLGISASDLNSVGIGSIVYTAGGGVSSIEIGGASFSGTEVRQKLKLRSTAFIMTWTGDSVTVTTKGFGHRVGMSQYGAEAMAVQGADYQSILSHYYQGAILSDVVG